MVDQRLRGDEGQQVRFTHAVHARGPLFRDVIHVMTVNKSDGILLLLNKQKKTHRESHEARENPSSTTAAPDNN